MVVNDHMNWETVPYFTTTENARL